MRRSVRAAWFTAGCLLHGALAVFAGNVTYVTNWELDAQRSAFVWRGDSWDRAVFRDFAVPRGVVASVWDTFDDAPALGRVARRAPGGDGPPTPRRSWHAWVVPFSSPEGVGAALAAMAIGGVYCVARALEGARRRGAPGDGGAGAAAGAGR